MNEHPQLFEALPRPVEDALRESIQRFGVLVPVVRDQHGRMIDGRHRARMADALGVKYRVDVVTVADDAEAQEIQRTLNADRRQLTEEQRREVAAALRAEGHSLRAIAGALGVSHEQVRQDVSGVNDLTPDDRVRGSDGKSYPARRPTVVPAHDERQAARAQQALRTLGAETLAPTLDVRDVERIARVQSKAARVAAFADRTPAPLADLGPFPVLYADPPWRYDYAEDSNRRIENQYPTMTLDEICELRVPAAEDSVLFLWVTSPKLIEGLGVIAAWGFEYRTCMVWVKDRIGMGYYARQQHELLLIAKRGGLPVPDPEDRPSSVINAVRGQHSAKPEETYELIERMYPLRDKCELFQRQPRPGWTGWGNQVVEVTA